MVGILPDDPSFSLFLSQRHVLFIKILCFSSAAFTGSPHFCDLFLGLCSKMEETEKEGERGGGLTCDLSHPSLSKSSAQLNRLTKQTPRPLQSTSIINATWHLPTFWWMERAGDTISGTPSMLWTLCFSTCGFNISLLFTSYRPMNCNPHSARITLLRTDIQWLHGHINEPWIHTATWPHSWACRFFITGRKCVSVSVHVWLFGMHLAVSRPRMTFIMVM